MCAHPGVGQQQNKSFQQVRFCLIEGYRTFATLFRLFTCFCTRLDACTSVGVPAPAWTAELFYIGSSRCAFGSFLVPTKYQPVLRHTHQALALPRTTVSPTPTPRWKSPNSIGTPTTCGVPLPLSQRHGPGGTRGARVIHRVLGLLTSLTLQSSS